MKALLMHWRTVLSRKTEMFYLQLLEGELNFDYQFYSRMTPLVESTVWNSVELFVLMSFHYFKLYFDMASYLEREVSFAPNWIDKVEKISKGSLDLIPSPSPSVKIQIMGGKICLRCKGKTLLGIVNKLLKTKRLLTSPSNVLPYYLK